MGGERTYAILPCRTLDDIVPFYEALGFAVTYRQERPNPYLVVRREDLQLHFAGIEDFDPERSYGSVIVVVPDAEALHREFAAGLRAAFGKAPASGIPRLLRPRRKRGTVSGFSVVDPGGNWLRVYREGDDATAARVLDAALARHVGAPAVERLPALVYRAELATRLGDAEGGRAALDEALALPLTGDERELLAVELAAIGDLGAG